MVRRFLVGISLAVAGLSAAMVPQVVVATDSILNDNGNICDDGNGIPDDLKEAAGCKLNKDATVMPVAVSLIEVALSVIGILTVGMIVCGGIFYVISNGDAAKLQRAKNTILYGVVGLLVSLLAFSLVRFISQSIWG